MFKNTILAAVTVAAIAAVAAPAFAAASAPQSLIPTSESDSVSAFTVASADNVPQSLIPTGEDDKNEPTSRVG